MASVNSKKNIRIKDVAERANVSTATVSHVINGTRYVSPEVTERVVQVMEELDYRPNSAARSLRSTKTNTIGFLIPVKKDDTSKSFFMSIAEGIEANLNSKGYNLILSNSKEDMQEEIKRIKMFNTQLVDGLILAPTNDDFNHIQEVLDNQFPIVMIDRLPINYDGDFVLVDNFQGTYDGVTKLVASGYKKIGFISSELGITTTNERFEGYKQALKDNNIQFNDKFVELGLSSFQSGYELTEKLITKQIDSLFIANNIMTMGSVKCIQDNGLQMPDDIAVIGYDNYDWTKITTPPLSVVNQPAFDIGFKAADCILNRINNKDKKKAFHIKLKAHLKVRKSI
ncbi:LacI family DNA-binding transcriptional regulator [Gracilibacillus salitolerans]|uniref:LacI family DNA-binding transcriptional regulator n=1 Tax=Gracilibacillus salitolerans TaxID=2663022 RepID=A0A5Q2TJN0_9BACI|nr:LacI family DNA-binding transcriptional regulator [Gracilibacillus salitolerans]QGH34287.1 LacI family DNA-binding transcriptional regulator [Gracilibacillus salitolerans]